MFTPLGKTHIKNKDISGRTTKVSVKYLGEIQYNTIQYREKEEFQVTTKSLEESFDGEGCKGRHT